MLSLLVCFDGGYVTGLQFIVDPICQVIQFFYPLTWIVESVVEQWMLYEFSPQILCCYPKILCSFVHILLLLVIDFSFVVDPVCLNSEPLDLKFGYQD